MDEDETIFALGCAVTLIFVLLPTSIAMGILLAYWLRGAL